MIKIYDTTLRDGVQQRGLSFSVADKLKIAQKLIDFGIGYIEGGFPGSNPKDAEFFEKAKTLNWKDCYLTAFCPTRYKKNTPESDPSLQSVIASGVKIVTVFGKTWDLHAKDILDVSEDENYDIIYSTIKYLREQKLRVIFDAEHFYDGFFQNEKFALRALEAAVSAGAENLSLCETNGGMLPSQIKKATKKVAQEFPNISIGIHAHNDAGLGVANSLTAVEAGADMVQGTINGFGERTGNANLCTIIPNLALKMKKTFKPKINLKHLMTVSNVISEIANMPPPDRLPYVGTNAFAHKAGVHVAAVAKNPKSYEHINPSLVGNERHTLVSELSGRTNVLLLAKDLGMNLDKNSALAKKILADVKVLEAEGFAFESAEASFKLLMLRAQDDYEAPFQVLDFLILNRLSRENVEAEIQVRIGDNIETRIDFGNGPVNALDKAFRKALLPYFPELDKLKLMDYKVRIINSSSATAAKTRVLIESTNGQQTWTTVGCHENITKASVQALVDAFEVALIKN